MNMYEVYNLQGAGDLIHQLIIDIIHRETPIKSIKFLSISRIKKSSTVTANLLIITN